jgi:hypothetical protein
LTKRRWGRHGVGRQPEACRHAAQVLDREATIRAAVKVQLEFLPIARVERIERVRRGEIVVAIVCRHRPAQAIMR